MQIPEIGAQVIFLERCDSTNVELSRTFGRPDTINGTVVLAYEQTAGKGQRGNSWTTSAGKDLTFSFLLTQPAIKAENAFHPIAAAAVATCLFLRSKMPHSTIEIKWPNDILCNGKKICGMLIENTFTGNISQRTIVGIGINLNGEYYSDTRFPATSYFLETGNTFSISETLSEFLPYLNRSFTQMYISAPLLFKTYNSLLYASSEFVPALVGETEEMVKIWSVDMQGIPHITTKTNGLPKAARHDEFRFLPPQ